MLSRVKRMTQMVILRLQIICHYEDLYRNQHIHNVPHLKNCLEMLLGRLRCLFYHALKCNIQPMPVQV
jgi:hypothetical protein